MSLEIPLQAAARKAELPSTESPLPSSRARLGAPDNVRGLLVMAIGFALFSVADTQAKLLTEFFHPVQIVWIRQLGLLAGVVVALAVLGPSIFATRHPALQFGRGLLAVTSAVCFIVAIKFVPLADAVAISFVAPFLVTAMGALFLGETVGPRRWSAVIVGFCGALIVIRPGLGVMHPAGFMVIVAATAFAARQVLSRHLAKDDRTVTTVAYTALVSILALSIPLPFFWTTPTFGMQWALLFGMALFAALGELMIIKSLEIAHASVLAPVHYSLLIWGTFWGWLVLGQLPDMWTWAGAAVIVTTGIYIIRCERKVKSGT